MKLSGLVRSMGIRIRRLGQTMLPDWMPRLVFWLYVALYLTWFSGVFGF